MYRRFAFEGDIHDTLACVPLAIRRKLDLAALKISLDGWQRLSRAERLALCHLPVDSAAEVHVYREILRGFASRSEVTLRELDAVDAGSWGREQVPELLRGRIDDAKWRTLDEESRYALVKLADPKREVGKLLQLLAELGLGDVPDAPVELSRIVCGRP